MYCKTLSDFYIKEFAVGEADICGREYEKTQMLTNLIDSGLNEMLYLSSCSMYMITGPIGYGKSHLATCCAAANAEAGYQIYHIDCADFIDEDEPEQIWKSLGEEIVEKTDPEEMGDEKVCLYLEGLGLVGENRKLTRAIADTLKKLEEKQCRCIVYATEVDAARVPVLILKHFMILELGAPNLEERSEFFVKFLEFQVEEVLEDEFVLEEREAETYVFYPLDVKNTMDKDAGSGAAELEKVALYCAKHTEGFSFKQLAQVIEVLTKTLKKKLWEVSSEHIDQLAAHIKNGQTAEEKTYVITEEKFLEILSNVRKMGEVLNRAQLSTISSGKETAATVVSQPQIVYAMPPQGMVMQQTVPMQGYGNNNYNNNYNQGVNSEEQEKVLNAADTDNPDIGTLVSAFKTLPSSENVDKYISAEKQ